MIILKYLNVAFSWEHSQKKKKSYFYDVSIFSKYNQNMSSVLHNQTCIYEFLNKFLMC